MKFNVKEFKRGDICKYTVNGVEWYMIILQDYTNESTENDILAGEDNLMWVICRGFQVDDISNFVDLKSEIRICYKSINYVRIKGNVYFPLISSYVYTPDMRIFLTGNEECENKIDIIGHLSNEQMYFMNLMSHSKMREHGIVYDIDTLDLSEIDDVLKQYIQKFDLVNSGQVEKSELHKLDSELKDMITSIQTWAEAHISAHMPQILESVVHNNETDYDVKDVREFEDGGLYQYIDYDGEIRYSFIWVNSSKNMSDSKLDECRENGESVIVGACDASIFHDESIFTHSEIFSNGSQCKFAYNTRNYGYFRILGKYYIPSDGIHNWVWYDYESFSNELERRRPKLIAKIHPSQLKCAFISCKYQLNNRIIDIDLVDVEKIDPILSMIDTLEHAIAENKRHINRYSSNIVKAVINKKCIKQRGPVEADAISEKKKLD